MFRYSQLHALLGLTLKAQDYSHVSIVRLSFIEGDVQYQRPGSDWEDAKLNLPIQQGFRLQTVNGYAEVEFESGLAIRLANNSSLEFAELSLSNGRNNQLGWTPTPAAPLKPLKAKAATSRVIILASGGDLPA